MSSHFDDKEENITVNVNVDVDVNVNVSSPFDPDYNLTVTPHLDPEIDYWAKLKEICGEGRRKVVMNSSFSEEEVKMDFVRERLVETTNFIDTRIESIFKIAQEEESDTTAHFLTAEFLEQLIEFLEDLCWLVSRIPEDIGRRLVKKYVSGFESIIEIVGGIERIWWSIRKGYCGLPRNRDYSTSHFFRTLQLSALDDAIEQWTDWISQLKESTDELRRISETNEGLFEKNCVRIIVVTFNIFKKIKLNWLNETTASIEFCDNLLDSGELIIFHIKQSTRLLLINSSGSNLIICARMYSLNERLHELIGDEVRDDWFKSSLKEIDTLCEHLSSMNPIR